jgi:3-oxoadipate:acetyl-CoA acetyltransferase
MKTTIINFCPTGMIPDKSQTPFVPISPAEIIDQVQEAYEMGITIAHLHAREESGQPSYRKSVYRDIFEGVRKYCPDLVICGSTSGRHFPEFEKRSAVIELQPDMCSLTLSSLNFYQQASVNSPDMISMLARKMLECGVKPELECFDMGMINYGKYLIQKAILQPPFYWNLLFGNIAGFQANLTQMAAAANELNGKDHFVSFGGVGQAQFKANAVALIMGYGVRVGLEDNIWLDKARMIKASNIELLKRIHALMEIHENKLLSSSEFGKSGFYNAHTLARL